MAAELKENLSNMATSIGGEDRPIEVGIDRFEGKTEMIEGPRMEMPEGLSSLAPPIGGGEKTYYESERRTNASVYEFKPLGQMADEHPLGESRGLGTATQGMTSPAPVGMGAGTQSMPEKDITGLGSAFRKPVPAQPVQYVTVQPVPQEHLGVTAVIPPSPKEAQMTGSILERDVGDLTSKGEKLLERGLEAIETIKQMRQKKQVRDIMAEEHIPIIKPKGPGLLEQFLPKPKPKPTAEEVYAGTGVDVV